MKKTNIFVALSASAALAAAAALWGCSDNNVDFDYRTDTTSATEEADRFVETEPETTTVTTTVKTTKKKTTTTKTTTTTAETTETETETTIFDNGDGSYVEYHFRNSKLLNQHFEKHGSEFGKEFGYDTAEDYEKGASDVINDPDALHKTEAEDGDFVYYIEETNEFVILSTDGYIRTYFRPNAGIDYYNRQ